MTKNIQICALGGYITPMSPYLYLHGVKNIVRDISGLDYTYEVKESNGTVNSKREKKELFKFAFTIPFDEFRASKITHNIEYSFLVYNTFPDFTDSEEIKAVHFNGYITKLKTENQNSYTVEIIRTTPFYKVSLLDKYWLDTSKDSRQDAFEKIERSFLKPTLIKVADYTPPIVANYKEISTTMSIYRIKKTIPYSLLYITISNTSSESENLLSFTNKPLESEEEQTQDTGGDNLKITLLDKYAEYFKTVKHKSVSNWNTSVFLNTEQIKGLCIENNKLVENVKANVIKTKNVNSDYFLDICTRNKNSEIYYLEFKEIEIC